MADQSVVVGKFNERVAVYQKPFTLTQEIVLEVSLLPGRARPSR
jgi:hypothetical protein